MEEFYTKLFVENNFRHEKFLELLSVQFNSNVDVFTFEVGKYEIDVLMNKEYKENTEPNDFMFFPYTVEIVNVEPTQLCDYLQFIRELMMYLRKHKSKVVAACDWEEQLEATTEY